MTSAQNWWELSYVKSTRKKVKDPRAGDSGL